MLRKFRAQAEALTIVPSRDAATRESVSAHRGKHRGADQLWVPITV
jgi:hypothetical protein